MHRLDIDIPPNLMQIHSISHRLRATCSGHQPSSPKIQSMGSLCLQQDLVRRYPLDQVRFHPLAHSIGIENDGEMAILCEEHFLWQIDTNMIATGNLPTRWMASIKFEILQAWSLVNMVRITMVVKTRKYSSSITPVDKAWTNVILLSATWPLRPYFGNDPQNSWTISFAKKRLTQ